MISIPVAVNNNFFKWQAELWWWNHCQIYGDQSRSRGLMLLIDKNYQWESDQSYSWCSHIPHERVRGIWQNAVDGIDQTLAVPLNIQYGLKQILDKFHDDEVLEIIDCDMFHFRAHPTISPGIDDLYVSDVYEAWHLKSLTDNKNVIEIYFENQGKYYNGGFVPIIGRASTFRKIITEWEAVHRDILKRNYDANIKWWAGMFALQAACEKARVNMISKDWCYIPEVNDVADHHYIGHYSVDKKFSKQEFPRIDTARFLNNPYYQRIKNWLDIYLTDN
jgi:hypothetical protein